MKGGPGVDESSNVQRMIEQARDAMTVRRVFGDPYEKNGVTVIPAARVQGGAGGGGGEGPEGQGAGTGGGFGVNAKPAGAFVIHGDDVDWRPARRQPDHHGRPADRRGRAAARDHRGAEPAPQLERVSSSSRGSPGRGPGWSSG